MTFQEVGIKLDSLQYGDTQSWSSQHRRNMRESAAAQLGLHGDTETLAALEQMMERGGYSYAKQCDAKRIARNTIMARLAGA